MTETHSHLYKGTAADVFASMLGGYGVRYTCACGAHQTADGIHRFSSLDMPYADVRADVHRRVFKGAARVACVQAVRNLIIRSVREEQAA